MPNHIHGIVILRDDVSPATVGAGFKSAPTPRHPLTEVIRALKTFSARRINQLRGTPGEPVWQRNYYEHVVRDERDLCRIRDYVADNPSRWADDVENLAPYSASPRSRRTSSTVMMPAPTSAT